MKNEILNDELNKLKEEIQNNINLFQKSTTVDDKRQDLRKMIEYYGKMTDEVEKRRQQIMTFSLTTLTICIPAIGIVFSQAAAMGRIVFWPIFIVLLIQMIFSVIIAIVYEKQSAYHYPFLKLEEYGNQWKWFYKGNAEIQKIPTSLLLSENKIKLGIEGYLKGLNLFTKNYADENREKEIEGNIKQLYLLQVHNYYKNQFYLQLARWRRIAFYSIPISLFLALLVVFYFSKAEGIMSSHSDNIKTDSSTGLIRSDSVIQKCITEPVAKPSVSRPSLYSKKEHK